MNGAAIFPVVVVFDAVQVLVPDGNRTAFQHVADLQIERIVDDKVVPFVVAARRCTFQHHGARHHEPVARFVPLLVTYNTIYCTTRYNTL